MFSRISRYRKLPDIVTIDSQGRTLPSKALRLLPEVSGTFHHTIEDIDRLDHLAYKYYQQPRKWWRIVDANPEFMSPQALLGKESIITDRFPLTFDGEGMQPPWSILVQYLTERLGVEEVKVEEEIRLVPQAQTVDGQTDTVYVEQFARAVVVTYNRMNVSIEELISFIKAIGFDASQPERIGRVGKQIVIPRDSTG
jgi:hypothetical protein